MEVVLKQAGKRFQYEWIFKNLSYDLKTGRSYGVKGPNGSGKSTLLKVLSGYLSLNEGQIQFVKKGIAVEANQVFKHVSITGPYVELIEEYTPLELLRFHFRFRPPYRPISPQDALKHMNLHKAASKEIKFLSSGMKQRLKIGLAVLANADLILLDEPGSNLDETSKTWVSQLLQEWKGERTLVIASNEVRDFEGCQEMISIEDYKPKPRTGQAGKRV